MRKLVRRYPVSCFALLALAISWSAALGGASELLVGSGPFIAALVCQGLTAGVPGMAAHLRHCFTPQMNRPAWLLAVIAPIAILLVATLIGAVRGGAWPQWRESVAIAPLNFAATLMTVAWNGPGEEPGWRGYALPRLLALYNPLNATALVAAVWIPWHYPVLYMRGEFTPVLVPAFSVALLFGAVWLTAIYRLSGGSVFACVIWHALWNMVATVGRNLTPSVFPWMGGMVAVVAITLLVWQWREWRRAPLLAPATSPN